MYDRSRYGIWKTLTRVSVSIGAAGATACLSLRAYRYRLPSTMLDFHAPKICISSSRSSRNQIL
jgi:hypothetical protein